MERTDGAGEENVLLAPPSVLAAVALVPAFEPAASLMAVSPVVERVAGLDTAFAPPKFRPLCEACIESLLRVGELSCDPDNDRGVENDGLPLPEGADGLYT